MSEERREPLSYGTELKLSLTNGRKEVYQILDVIGLGGNCIVYNGICKSSSEEKKNKEIIKEFFPKSLTGIERENNALKIPEAVIQEFNIRKEVFSKGTQEHKEEYQVDNNHIMPIPHITNAIANNTSYSVTKPTLGNVLSEIDPITLSISEIGEIIISLCNGIGKFHSRGKLYLDIKPQNIFLFKKEYCESRRIGLFDFDTVMHFSDLKMGNFSYGTYTEGWAPMEQMEWTVNELSFKTDIYSIGAVFFWLLMGRRLKSRDVDEIHWGNFNLKEESKVLKEATEKLVAEANEILKSTIQNDIQSRYDDINMLKIEIEKLKNSSIFEMFQKKSEGNNLMISEGNYTSAFDLNEMVDRIGMIEKIEESLAKNSKPTYIYSDVRGMGKTTIASAFSNSPNVYKYKYVFWLDLAEDVNDIRESITKHEDFKSGKAEDVSDEAKDKLSIEIKYKLFLRKVKPYKDVLLIIDNVENLEQIEGIEEYIPDLRWNVLVTTRAIKESANFKKRIIYVSELEDNYCEELFYSIYNCDDSFIEGKRDTVFKLFDLLSHNTKLIKMYATEAHESRIKIEEMVDFLEKNLIQYDESAVDMEYEKLIDGLKTLYELVKFSKDEEKILQFISILPCMPIGENVLLDWIADNSNESKYDVRKTLNSLSQKGWLLNKRHYSSEEVTYQMHSLVIASIRLQNKVNQDELNPYIGRMAEYIKSEVGGLSRKTYLIPYLGCVEAILREVKEVSVELFNLKRYYLRLMTNNFFMRKGSLEFAYELVENYKEIFGGDPVSYEDKRELCSIKLLFNGIYGDFSEDKGKSKILLGYREELLNYAKGFLEPDDLVMLRVKRTYSNSLKANEKIEESIEVIYEILDTINKSEYLKKDEYRKWIDLHIKCLSSLGISYNRLYSRTEIFEKKVEYLKKALEFREKALEISMKINSDSEIALSARYNDLGMTYKFMYDLYKNNEYVEKSFEFLSKSYEIRVECESGIYSFAAARAAANLSNILQVKGDLENALKLAKQSLEVRKSLRGNETSKGVLQSYRRLSEVQIGMYDLENDIEKLYEAEENIKKSLEISLFLFDEHTDHIEIKKNKRILEKIQKKLTIINK